MRDGSRFGAICPQIIGQEVKGDEDCLTLNVWRPRAKPAQKLPVMSKDEFNENSPVRLSTCRMARGCAARG